MKRELANGHVLHVLGGQDPVEVCFPLVACAVLFGKC